MWYGKERRDELRTFCACATFVLENLKKFVNNKIDKRKAINNLFFDSLIQALIKGKEMKGRKKWRYLMIWFDRIDIILIWKFERIDFVHCDEFLMLLNKFSYDSPTVLIPETGASQIVDLTCVRNCLRYRLDFHYINLVSGN